MGKSSLLEKELEVVSGIGFKNREEFLEEAVNTYLAARKDVRISMAAALYNEGKVSIGKAVEISSLSIEGFKAYLKKAGIERKLYESSKAKGNALKY